MQTTKQVLQSCLLIRYYIESTTADKYTQEAATYLSESISVLNATEFPDCSLEHSDFDSSIMDQASMSDGMVNSNLPPSTHYHQAFDSNSGALSPTLSLPLSLSKGDPSVYGGHYDRSQSMPPNNHRSQQGSTYFHTPTIHKRPHLQRRFTYPPTPGYSLCTPTSDLVGLLCSVHELYIHVYMYMRVNYVTISNYCIDCM